MVITREDGEWGEAEEGVEEVSGDGRRIDLGGERTVQYTDGVL